MIRWNAHTGRRKAGIDLAIISALAVVVFMVAAWFDLFERFAAWSAQYNRWQVNEVATVLVFLSLAFAIFAWRRWRDLKAETIRRREYSDLFRLANDSILIFDAIEATVLDVNDKACEVYRIPREQFIGRRLEDITQDPEGAQRRLCQVRKKGKLEGFEVIHVGSDGSLIHFLINRTLIEYQGRQAILSIERDITERRRIEEARREAERKYRNIFENAVEGIFQTTPDGSCITANPALARMFGFETPQELIDARTNIGQCYVHPERREEFKRLIEQKNIVRGFEFESYRKDGSRVWLSEDVRAVRDDTGRVIYYEGIAQDITERKHAEARSAAFATLARKLSGAIAPLDAGSIIAETADDLFGWDACNLDLYDADLDLIRPMLNIDLINGEKKDVTPFVSDCMPTARGRRVIERGAELILREEPIRFDDDAAPFGDRSLPSASIMSVPIRHSSQVIGLLCIQSYTPNAYSQTDLEDFQSLADHCAQALHRIHAEESLRDSEERYRDLVENSRELICTHDLDGLILSANPAAAEALGYDSKEFAGKKNIRDILAPGVRYQFEEYLEAMRRRGSSAGQMLVQTSSGEQRVWEYYNSLRTEGVNTPIVRGMARDVTEQRRAEKALRESEERYRELFENAKDAIYVHDLNGRYVSVNRAAEKLSGYRRDEIIGKHFSNFVVPRDLKHVRTNLCKKLDAANETVYEVEVMTKDRRRVPVEVSSRLIYEDGVPIGVQGTARDITERRHAQHALRNYSRKLIEAQEAERQSIARELHDQIGQILTAVRLNLESIKGSCQTIDCLPKIDDSVAVIDEGLTRVRALSLELRPSLLDNLGLTAALRWYLDRYAQRTGIATEILGGFDDNRRLSHEVETACFRISQEALTNVARHAKAQRVTIELRYSLDKLLLEIVDDGVGFQTNGFVTNGADLGSLGLRGMRERALAVGGTIEIDSAPEAGTRVRARFPLDRSS